MKVILFFLLLLSGISVYQFLRIREANSIGQQLVTSSKAFSHHPPNPTLNILVLGDSLAVGVGASDTNNSIAGRIAKDYPTAAMTNAAKSGARIHDVIDQLQPFMNDQFDILLIQIGGNDVTHMTNTQQVHRDMNTIITQAKKISPHIIVYSSGSAGFAPMFIPPFSWFYTVQTKRIYSTIAHAAEESGATYIDLYVPWNKDIFKTDTKRYYAEDTFHVTDDAYGAWYEKIKPTLKEIMR